MSEQLKWTLFLWPVAAVLIWGLQVFLRSTYYLEQRIRFYDWLGLRLMLLIVRVRHHINKLQGHPPAHKIRVTWERKNKYSDITEEEATFFSPTGDPFADALLADIKDTDEDLPLEQL